MKNNETITNDEIKKNEIKKNIVIANNYSQIFATLEDLKKQLENTKDDDIKRGYIMAQIALLNKKKAKFENVYFDY